MWETVKSWWQAIVDFFYKILLSIFDFLKDLVFFVLDTLIKAGLSILDLLEGGLDALNPLEYINAIPEETRAFMAMTGFNEVMVIIVGAILIRFTLQLIPFVRWGS